jgi:hypothetical protein
LAKNSACLTQNIANLCKILILALILRISPSPPEFTQIRMFWFENIPSGNPDWHNGRFCRHGGVDGGRRSERAEQDVADQPEVESAQELSAAQDGAD